MRFTITRVASLLQQTVQIRNLTAPEQRDGKALSATVAVPSGIKGLAPAHRRQGLRARANKVAERAELWLATMVNAAPHSGADGVAMQ